MLQIQSYYSRLYTGERRSSGTQDGNEDTQNDEYGIEANAPTPNWEIILQIGLQLKCGMAIQCIAKLTYVLQ